MIASWLVTCTSVVSSIMSEKKVSLYLRINFEVKLVSNPNNKSDVNIS